MAKDNLLLLLENPFYGVYFSETDFSLQIESIHGLKHDYINILQDYLLQHTSPFSVKELRDIGLADIVGKIKILESNMFQNGEWAYLDDSATIDIADLQQRLLDFLFDSFVKRHPSKYIYSTRIESYAESYRQNHCAQLKAFYKIKQIFIKEAENNPYISIEVQNTSHELRCEINFDGRIWIQLSVKMSNSLTLYKVPSQYDQPPYFINIDQGEKPFSIFCRFDNEKSKQNIMFQDVKDIIFEQPDNMEKHKTAIRNAFLFVFEEQIQLEEIIYDPVRKCYCLSKEKEQKMFNEFIPQESKCKQFAKYTSFSTLMATLQSGRIRMNSIVGMNDKTEMFFLSDTIKNFQESIAEEGDNLFLANRNFITSFSERIDELDMWRFYGDNAHGVCMVFESKENSETGIKEVLYINKETNDSVKRMNEILSKLKDDKINFRFPILDKHKPFYKSEEFKNEAEHRLLMVSDKQTNWVIAQPYNILSPYVERDLGIDGQDGNTDSPLVLKKIILGPEMLNKEINKIQLEQFIKSRYSNDRIEICESRISTYR